MYKGKDFGKKLCKASGHCTDKASASKKKEKKEDKKPKADKKPDQKTDKKVEKKEVTAATHLHVVQPQTSQLAMIFLPCISIATKRYRMEISNTPSSA